MGQDLPQEQPTQRSPCVELVFAENKGEKKNDIAVNKETKNQGKKVKIN